MKTKYQRVKGKTKKEIVDYAERNLGVIIDMDVFKGDEECEILFTYHPFEETKDKLEIPLGNITIYVEQTPDEGILFRESSPYIHPNNINIIIITKEEVPNLINFLVNKYK